MRIRPKMSENPDASRNNRPPKVTLLTVSTIQKFIVEPFSILSFLGARETREPGIQGLVSLLLDSGFRLSPAPE